MKDVSLSSALSELRGILKAAIDHCDTIPDAPAEIRAAVIDHSLSFLGIEEVIELVRRSRHLASSTAHSYRLLEQHLRAAEAARRNIQNATATHRHTRLGLKASRVATRRKDFTLRLLSNLSRIVTALNSAILLAVIRLENDQTRLLVTKLRSLIDSCQRANGSPQTLAHETVGCGSKSQGEPCGGNDTELEELLQPSSVAYVLSELHAVHARAGASAFGGAILPPRNTQLLSINLLSLLLERQPLHPAHVVPTLVSYHSDIVVATRGGNHARVLQILKDAPELLYCFTIDNLSLMSFAIESGEIKIVHHLLQNGIDVNDTYGRSDTSPLATALEFRHLHIARLLIQAGADFHHKNSYGWSPLFYIWFKEDRISSAGPLLGLLAASTIFHVMHRNVYDKDGWSVMHRAAIYGTSQDVSTLVQLGVDPFSVTRSKEKNPADDNIHEYSVLQHVVLDGLTDMVKVLLPIYRERFGNVDLANEQGWTLLHMAVQEQHLPIVRMLVENGADVWAKTEPTLIARVSDRKVRRCTPFSLAKSSGRSFFQDFVHIVQRHQQKLRQASIQAVKKTLCDQRISVPPSSRLAPASMDEQVRAPRRLVFPNSEELEPRTTHRKVFGGTTISDNASAHLGDSIRHYRITHYSFRGRSSKAKLKRIKLLQKMLQQAKHVSHKEVQRTLYRSKH